MAPKLQPLKIVIAALGGEGGSVLTKWLIDTAERIGYLAQYTSIPGVAQRTGATTYYIELFPVTTDTPAPIMALTPSPGDIDIVVASELLEVGRAIEKGLVTPGKTTLIGSTHRMYAVSEKTAMTDNRYQSEIIITAAQEFADTLILQDLKVVSEKAGSIINAVLFGALAASGKLGTDRTVFEDVIRAGGKAVDSNLAGFSAGSNLTEQANGTQTSTQTTPLPVVPAPLPVIAEFPKELHPVLGLGLERTAAYQSQKYADLFMDRARKIFTADKAAGGQAKSYALSVETARYLALRMTYEDVIRVADIKTDAERLKDIQAKAGQAGAIVEIVDYFKPGIEEIRAILPRSLSAALKPFEAQTFFRPFKGGIRLKTTSITGYYALRAMAKLKWWRPSSDRFKTEQQNIDVWLGQVIDLAAQDYDLALEYTECANLLKGYGDTYRQGMTNFEKITALLTRIQPQKDAADILQTLRTAALENPDGSSLDQAIEAAGFS